MDKKHTIARRFPLLWGFLNCRHFWTSAATAPTSSSDLVKLKPCGWEEKSVSRAMPSSSFWGLTHKRNAIGEWSLPHPYPIERRKINA